MEKLQEVAKIGKSVLIQLVGVQPNFKTTRDIPVINEAECSKCDCCTYKLKKEIKKKINSSPAFLKEYDKLKKIENSNCYWNCPFDAVKLVSRTHYNNEENRYNIPSGSERLSKLQVKQLLLYHFYLEENNGIVRGLSVSEIARILNCDVKTVRNNNLRLVEQKYIWVTNISRNNFNVFLCDYKNYHLTAREGGSGYLYMTKELLKELIKVSNVNALRLDIRKLLAYDNANIGSRENKPAKFTKSDIKRVLPRYFNYKNILDTVVESSSSAFTTIKSNDYIEFTLVEKYNPDVVIERKSIEYMEGFMELLDGNGVVIDDVYKGDLVQMSFQYNFRLVYDSVKTLISSYFKKGKDTTNFGGLVRTIIRKKIEKSYAM